MITDKSVKCDLMILACLQIYNTFQPNYFSESQCQHGGPDENKFHLITDFKNSTFCLKAFKGLLQHQQQDTKIINDFQNKKATEKAILFQAALSSYEFNKPRQFLIMCLNPWTVRTMIQYLVQMAMGYYKVMSVFWPVNPSL